MSNKLRIHATRTPRASFILPHHQVTYDDMKSAIELCNRWEKQCASNVAGKKTWKKKMGKKGGKKKGKHELKTIDKLWKDKTVLDMRDAVKQFLNQVSVLQVWPALITCTSRMKKCSVAALNKTVMWSAGMQIGEYGGRMYDLVYAVVQEFEHSNNVTGMRKRLAEYLASDVVSLILSKVEVEENAQREGEGGGEQEEEVDEEDYLNTAVQGMEFVDLDEESGMSDANAPDSDVGGEDDEW